MSISSRDSQNFRSVGFLLIDQKNCIVIHFDVKNIANCSKNNNKNSNIADEKSNNIDIGDI